MPSVVDIGIVKGTLTVRDVTSLASGLFNLVPRDHVHWFIEGQYSREFVSHSRVRCPKCKQFYSQRQPRHNIQALIKQVENRCTWQKTAEIMGYEATVLSAEEWRTPIFPGTAFKGIRTEEWKALALHKTRQDWQGRPALLKLLDSKTHGHNLAEAYLIALSGALRVRGMRDWRSHVRN